MASTTMTRCVLGILLFPAAVALGESPIFSWPAGTTQAEAINRFESQLDPENFSQFSNALAWLARQRKLDLRLLEGKTVEQIVAQVEHERRQELARHQEANPPPLRLRIPTGATQTKAEGKLPAHGNQRYLIRAEAGQILEARITGAGSPVEDEPPVILVVYGKDGTVLLTDHASAATFRGILPSTQDYIVEAVNETAQARPYVLKVKVSFPAAKTSSEAGQSLPWYAEPLKAGEYQWRPELATRGPVNIVVSLPQQMAYVYRQGVLIARTTVSTGRSGHRTPTGIFHILQKDKDHHSKKYNDAPMPYSERLTWGGVALHGGALPGYPSSHGCVHLPEKFARELFAITEKGTPVIVTNEPVYPSSKEPKTYTILSTQ